MHPLLISLTILLAALLLPFVLGPVLVRFKVFQRRYAPLREIDFFELPESARHFFWQSRNDLVNLGFVSVGCFTQRDQAPNITSFYEIWVNRASGDAALAAHSTSQTQSVTIEQTVFEFCTELSDGSEFCTSNHGEPSVFKYVPNKKVFKLPKSQDLPLLYRIHNHRLDRHGKNVERLLPTEGQEALRIVTSIDEDLRTQTAQGLMFFDQKADAYRPTWKGACLTTWKLVFPVKNVLQWQLQKQAAAMLAEIRHLP